MVLPALPHLATVGIGCVVVVLGVTLLITGVIAFGAPSHFVANAINPQWLAIFLSRRIPRENVTERDVEEEGSAGAIVAGGFAVAIGFLMIRYG